MANEMTPTAPDSVQCPVCFKDFKAATINGHLDVCLQKTVIDGSPSAKDESEPPLKKSRISGEAATPTATVNRPVASSTSSFSMAGTPSSSVLSFFQPNKSKVSAQSECSGSSSGKQTPASRGLKRNVPSEAEPGPAGPESQASGSDQQTLKSSKDLSARTLLTINKPLAETLRPNTLEEYFGQNKVVGQHTLLRSLLETQEIPSLILWGPPGCGKVGR